MEEEFSDHSLSPEEWNTAYHLVEVVKKNNLGTKILVYFEHDFSAINAVNPLSEIIITSPVESASIKSLIKKKLIDLEYSHGDDLYIITLREKLFVIVNDSRKRAGGSLL